MNNNTCPTCSTLLKEIQRLQRENERLQAKLLTAKALCLAYLNQAQGVMSNHCPRGQWAFARGVEKAAGEVLRRL